jgi:hypothetical protein
MLNRLARVQKLGIVLLPAVALGCATTGAATPAPSSSATVDPKTFDLGASKHVAVEMPAEAAEVRKNASAPILSVVTIDEVVYPYVYGYPLYPEGDAARGIAELRKAAAEGAKRSKSSDKDGVVHIAEELPAIGCRFDGIRETKTKFMPVSLTCDLPAPSALGGANRPVLGTIAAGAKAEEILKEPTVVENFLGAFHLTSDDFAGGSGTAFFNTTHGQVALVFKAQKLDHFVYYFDPGVAGWQDQKLWEGVL